MRPRTRPTSTFPPFPNTFHALPTFPSKSPSEEKSWMPKCSSRSARAKSGCSKKSALTSCSSWLKMLSSRMGLGSRKSGQPVLSSSLKGLSSSRSCSLSRTRCSSQEVPLYLPTCRARLLMKECFPVSAFPATNTFPSAPDARSAPRIASRHPAFSLWSTLKRSSVSHSGCALASMAAVSLTVSTLVSTEMTLMPFSRHCWRKPWSMQAAGFLTSRSSMAMTALSSSLGRLVTYFLMRLSLGLGRQADLFSRLISPYSPWSSTKLCVCAGWGSARLAFSRICCLKGNMLGRQSLRASPLCLRPLPRSFFASFLTRLLCCLTLRSILYLTLKVVRWEGRPFALFVNFTIQFSILLQQSKVSHSSRHLGGSPQPHYLPPLDLLYLPQLLQPVVDLLLGVLPPQEAAGHRQPPLLLRPEVLLELAQLARGLLLQHLLLLRTQVGLSAVVERLLLPLLALLLVARGARGEQVDARVALQEGQVDRRVAQDRLAARQGRQEVLGNADHLEAGEHVVVLGPLLGHRPLADLERGEPLLLGLAVVPVLGEGDADVVEAVLLDDQGEPEGVDGPAQRLVLALLVLLPALLAPPAQVHLHVVLGARVPRLHVAVELVDAQLQHLQVHGGWVLRLAGQRGQGREVEHLVGAEAVPPGRGLALLLFGEDPLEGELVEAGPLGPPGQHWLPLLLGVFVGLPVFAEGLHVPEEGLLVVVPAEVEEVLDEVDDEVVLDNRGSTLVGLIRFWILSLKLNISSYLKKKCRQRPTKSLRKLSSMRQGLVSCRKPGLMVRMISRLKRKQRLSQAGAPLGNDLHRLVRTHHRYYEVLLLAPLPLLLLQPPETLGRDRAADHLLHPLEALPHLLGQLLHP